MGRSGGAERRAHHDHDRPHVGAALVRLVRRHRLEQHWPDERVGEQDDGDDRLHVELEVGLDAAPP